MKALALNVCHVERSCMAKIWRLESKYPFYDLSTVDVFVQNPMEEVNYSTGVRTPAVTLHISM